MTTPLKPLKINFAELCEHPPLVDISSCRPFPRRSSMLNLAAAFGGGLLMRQTWDEIKLPRLKRSNETSSFRLSVRVVAASAPGFGHPLIHTTEEAWRQMFGTPADL
eukprot:s760_g6.t1